jgi:TP901 family phage tail tape measure protein
MKLADAAKVATTVMHQYGMEAGDMGKIADVIAHAASKSSAEVSDMGVAFNYFGTIAKQAHVSLAETAAAFEILAAAARGPCVRPPPGGRCCG